MLAKLHLKNVGPVADLEADFGPRLNVTTGDNGLGKTFLLDACWYALTRTWAGDAPFEPKPMPVYPTGDAVRPRRRRVEMSIQSSVRGKTSVVERQAVFNYKSWEWTGQTGRPAMPGLVLYGRIDGGFSIWDPARNYWRTEIPSRPPAFQFSKDEVWKGAEDKASGEVICNGLIRDLETWRLQDSESFHTLQRVLKTLSPSGREALSIGKPVRVSPKNAQDIPTLAMPYGNVPVIHAAAGMRRILALAYLLVWARSEHLRVSDQTGDLPGNRLVLLLDEVEAHLHPRWQRVILPALLTAVGDLMGQGLASIQIIASTHAPLILGSVEPTWDDERDALFDFDLGPTGEVTFTPRPFARRGSAEHWLTSESFDLPSAYSVEAEEAIAKACELMRRFKYGSDAPVAEKQSVQAELQRVLGNDDEFWPRWTPWFEDAYPQSAA